MNAVQHKEEEPCVRNTRLAQTFVLKYCNSSSKYIELLPSTTSFLYLLLPEWLLKNDRISRGVPERIAVGWPSSCQSEPPLSLYPPSLSLSLMSLCLEARLAQLYVRETAAVCEREWSSEWERESVKAVFCGNSSVPHMDPGTDVHWGYLNSLTRSKRRKGSGAM